MPAIPDEHQVLVLCADVPLIRPQTLSELVAAAREAFPCSPFICLIPVAMDASCAMPKIMLPALSKRRMQAPSNAVLLK